jgi:hypothetical protein
MFVLLRFGGDPPGRASRVLNTAALVLILFPDRLLNRYRSGFQSATVGRIDVSDIDELEYLLTLQQQLLRQEGEN